MDHIDRSIRYQLFKDKNVTRVSYTYEANRYVFTLKTYGGGPDTTGVDVAALQKCFSQKFGQIVDFRYEKLVGHYELFRCRRRNKGGKHDQDKRRDGYSRAGGELSDGQPVQRCNLQVDCEREPRDH